MPTAFVLIVSLQIRVLRGSRSPESTHYTTQKGEGKTNEDIDKTKVSIVFYFLTTCRRGKM